MVKTTKNIEVHHAPALLRVREVAIRCGVSPSFVRKLIERGTAFDTVRLGTAIRVTAESVDRYIVNHTMAASELHPYG